MRFDSGRALFGVVGMKVALSVRFRWILPAVGTSKVSKAMSAKSPLLSTT
jgi:hypothetical protein